MNRLLACLTLCAAVCHSVRAEDWPQFRGPTGEGIYRGAPLPLQWDSTKNVVWKQPIAGEGWSSPVVVGGKVYLTTAVPTPKQGPQDYSLRAVCLDAETGKTLWNVEVFQQDGATAPRIHSKNSHASPTPIVDAGQCFVHFGHQGTACLDAKTGAVIWKNRSFPYKPVHGNGGTPVLYDKLLIFSIDGSDMQAVVALDRATGKLVWKHDRQSTAPRKFSFHTPLIIDVKGQKQLISMGSNVVVALSPQDGKEIWRVNCTGYSIIPRPVYGHGLVFVSTGYDTASVLAIRVDGQGDVTQSHVQWSMKKGAPHTPSMILHGDEIYMVADNGLFTCADAKTGKIHYQERLPGGYSASLLLAGDRIYVQNETGVGIVLQIGKQFKELARNKVEGRTLASYAAVDGALYLRTDTHLYCIQERRTAAQ